MFERIFVNIIGTILFISLVNGYPSDLNGNKCSNYCSNDAVCLIIDNNPKCYCLPEWDGERCELLRQIKQSKQTKLVARDNLRNVPCDYVPTLCKNGGVCYLDDTGSNKLACKCPYPYDGARCEEYSVCYNFCFNNGICEVTGTDPKCVDCGERFEGTRCQSIKSTTTLQPPTTTTDVICSYLPDGYCNSGACVVINNIASCKCPSTHTGDQCQTDIGGSQSQGPIYPGITNPPFLPGVTNPSTGTGSSCSSNPCLNGRPCYNNGNTYYCYCGTQFGGNNCEYING